MSCGRGCQHRRPAELVCDVVGYQGEIVYDTRKPDGTRAMLDVSRAEQAGWWAKIGLREGSHRRTDGICTADLRVFRVPDRLTRAPG